MQNNKNVSDTAVPAMNSSITIRVSQKEKEHILELATKCGFRDVSTYIRARALNFRPKTRLTPRQEELLENLDGCRSDIYHYKNALGALSPEERKALLRQYSFLLAWVKLATDYSLFLKRFASQIRAVLAKKMITERRAKFDCYGTFNRSWWQIHGLHGWGIEEQKASRKNLLRSKSFPSTAT